MSLILVAAPVPIAGAGFSFPEMLITAIDSTGKKVLLSKWRLQLD